MFMKLRIALLSILFFGDYFCVQAQQSNNKGLKDYFKDYFTIGVAVSPRALKTDEAQLIVREFNTMTPENAMKMGPIHPFENQYNWAGGRSEERRVGKECSYASERTECINEG